MPHIDAVKADREGQVTDVVDVPLTVVITDVGCTTAAEVWVGPVRVTAFRTHTRYGDRALDSAHDVLADALRPLIDAAAARAGLSPYSTTDLD